MKFLIAFLLISNFLFSQNPSGEGIIFGKISDSKTSDPLEYVSVRLFNQIDSSLVTGVLQLKTANLILSELQTETILFGYRLLNMRIFLFQILS